MFFKAFFFQLFLMLCLAERNMSLGCIFIEFSITNRTCNNIYVMLLTQHLHLFIIWFVVRIFAHLNVSTKGYRLSLPLWDLPMTMMRFVCLFSFFQKLLLLFTGYPLILSIKSPPLFLKYLFADGFMLFYAIRLKLTATTFSTGDEFSRVCWIFSDIKLLLFIYIDNALFLYLLLFSVLLTYLFFVVWYC